MNVVDFSFSILLSLWTCALNLIYIFGNVDKRVALTKLLNILNLNIF